MQDPSLTKQGDPVCDCRHSCRRCCVWRRAAMQRLPLLSEGPGVTAHWCEMFIATISPGLPPRQDVWPVPVLSDPPLKDFVVIAGPFGLTSIQLRTSPDRASAVFDHIRRAHGACAQFAYIAFSRARLSQTRARLPRSHVGALGEISPLAAEAAQSRSPRMAADSSAILRDLRDAISRAARHDNVRRLSSLLPQSVPQQPPEMCAPDKGCLAADRKSSSA